MEEERKSKNKAINLVFYVLAIISQIGLALWGLFCVGLWKSAYDYSTPNETFQEYLFENMMPCGDGVAFAILLELVVLTYIIAQTILFLDEKKGKNIEK
jgi:hypothetical protein